MIFDLISDGKGDGGPWLECHATRRSTAPATPEGCPKAPGVGVGQIPALPVCALNPWALAPWPATSLPSAERLQPQPALGPLKGPTPP